MSAVATVLVADDQARFRSTVRELLEKRGHRVLEAADGMQALATCRVERPDVVVLDMVMPHLDGMGVCRAMRADKTLPYIPILFYSQRDSTKDRVSALRAGGDDFCGKQVPPTELVARVDALIRIRRMLDGRRRSEIRAEEATSIPDAAEMLRALAAAYSRSARAGEPLSLVVVEVEGNADERRRRDITAALLNASRGDDIVGLREPTGWWLILPSTHFGGGMAAAERIWRALPPRPGFSGVAIGVAVCPNPAVDSADALRDTANAALQRAREEGTAHVCLVHHQAYLFRPD